MKSNLLQYYLNWNVKCYVLIILGISCLIVYVQQEYIIVPQIHNMLAVDIKTKEWLLSKFGEYRFASFVLTPLVILLRIYLYFFDVDSLDAWMVIPISLFNIFEFLYFLFVSMLLSVATNRTYRDSMNFVTSTYCTGLILYIIIVVFIVLCIVE